MASPGVAQLLVMIFRDRQMLTEYLTRASRETSKCFGNCLDFYLFIFFLEQQIQVAKNFYFLSPMQGLKMGECRLDHIISIA